MKFKNKQNESLVTFGERSTDREKARESLLGAGGGPYCDGRNTFENPSGQALTYVHFQFKNTREGLP